MRDMELYVLLRTLLIAQAPLRNLVDVQYPNRYQPTQQGVPTARSIFLFKIGPDKRYGWRSVTHKTVNDVIQRVERQSMETTIQFSASQPPTIDPAELTTSDVLNVAAGVMQSPDFVSALIINNASILRVTDIRNSHFKNDKDLWEENPSFDAVIKHEDVWIDGVPQIHTFEFNIHSV